MCFKIENMICMHTVENDRLKQPKTRLPGMDESEKKNSKK